MKQSRTGPSQEKVHGRTTPVNSDLLADSPPTAGAGPMTRTRAWLLTLALIALYALAVGGSASLVAL